jgi:hypothetical protein
MLSPPRVDAFAEGGKTPGLEKRGFTTIMTEKNLENERI